MAEVGEGFSAIRQTGLYPKRFFIERLRSLGISDERFSYALMPAKDSQRLQAIAKHLDARTEFVSEAGEKLYSGKIGSAKVLVLNSGLGAPATALTFETLLHAGVHSFLRVGSAGGIQPSVKTGDIVIPIGAVRGEGTSVEYVWAGYPAFADPALHASLIRACEQAELQLGLRWHSGVTWTHDAFFAESAENIRLMKEVNVLAVEMEVAALFTLAALRRVRAAAVLVVTDNMFKGRAGGSVYTDDSKRKEYLAGSNAIARIAVDSVRLDLHKYGPLKSRKR